MFGMACIYACMFLGLHAYIANKLQLGSGSFIISLLPNLPNLSITKCHVYTNTSNGWYAFPTNFTLFFFQFWGVLRHLSSSSSSFLFFFFLFCFCSSSTVHAAATSSDLPLPIAAPPSSDHHNPPPSATNTAQIASSPARRLPPLSPVTWSNPLHLQFSTTSVKNSSEMGWLKLSKQYWAVLYHHLGEKQNNKNNNKLN